MPDFVLETLDILRRDWPSESWRDVHVAVALSGGPDSVALFRALLAVKHETSGAGNISALHVNHGLRGAESDEDAQWCSQLCQTHAVPITILAGQAALRAADEGDGIEAAARAERYELLTAAAEQIGARYLLTAHTADDQAETILFRLLRGTGIHGLCGIPRTRVLTQSLTLVRPLLSCFRTTLLGTLEQLKQPYRCDSSNQSQDYIRNRIRNKLLPHLRENYNSEVDRALVNLAAQSSDTWQVLSQLSDHVLDECKLELSDTLSEDTHGTRRQLSLQTAPLQKQPRVLVCEALRTTWRNAGLPEQAMNFLWWNRLAELALDRSDGQVLNLPGNVRASKSEGCLILCWHVDSF